MYYHTIRFHSPRDFGQFSHEIGSWWKELVTFDDGQPGPDGCYLAFYRSETAIDKERQIDMQGAPWVAYATFNLSEDTAHLSREKEVIAQELLADDGHAHAKLLRSGMLVIKVLGTMGSEVEAGLDPRAAFRLSYFLYDQRHTIIQLVGDLEAREIDPHHDLKERMKRWNGQ